MTVAVAAGDPALDFLLGSREPTIRHAALTDLLGRHAGDPDVRAARSALLDGPIVRALIGGQRGDGDFGVHPYQKWAGAHWRLVSLAELAVPPAGLPGVDAAYDRILDWLLAPSHVGRVPVIAGRARRCASQEGNALVVGTWLGRADDRRVGELAANLVRWQWPDGGWNCDARPAVTHASFNESHPPLLGLARYAAATGNADARAAADAAAEFVLRHRVVFSERTGELAHRTLGTLHYPTYWHYDLLAGLRALAASGHVRDPRTVDALDLLESRRLAGGAWQAGSRWWRRPGSGGSNVEVADWGGRGPNEALTLAALRVLKAAGRWSAPAQRGPATSRQ
jgi:hypothetical protein